MLVSYYQAFKSLSGIVAGVFSTIPILSKLLLPDSFSAYGFPPLGNAEGPARIGAVIFALATTYSVFFTARETDDSGCRRRIHAAIICALIFLILYIGLFTGFVRKIEIPSKETAVQISVGFERTEFAKANFRGESDWEVLRERGTDEEQVWKLWTLRSIVISRLSLYGAYCIVLLSLVAAFSWGVLSELEKKAVHT